jgi:hypothetical protein
MHMHPRLCYLIMKKYTSRSQHKHIPSYTITISTFVTRYTFTLFLLLFEVCVYVTSHERIYVTVITYSNSFNIRHTLHIHFIIIWSMRLCHITWKNIRQGYNIFFITHNHNFNICHTLHLHFQYYITWIWMSMSLMHNHETI